jgi:hypothetical protein
MKTVGTRAVGGPSRAFSVPASGVVDWVTIWALHPGRDGHILDPDSLVTGSTSICMHLESCMSMCALCAVRTRRRSPRTACKYNVM